MNLGRPFTQGDISGLIECDRREGGRRCMASLRIKTYEISNGFESDG
jgi:hypothetical protein